MMKISPTFNWTIGGGGVMMVTEAEKKFLMILLMKLKKKQRTAANFVASIDTIGLAVAVVASRNALVSRLTGELMVFAAGTWRIGGTIRFVGRVPAIVIAVAHPCFKYATFVGAPEFVRLATVRI